MKRKKQPPGFFPNSHFRPEDENVRYTPEQTDQILNDIFDGITWWRLARKWKRSTKAMKRQFETMIYTEKASKAFTYTQTNARVSRSGGRIKYLDRKVARTHSERHIGLKITAKILARAVEEVVSIFKIMRLPVPTHYGVPYGPRH